MVSCNPSGSIIFDPLGGNNEVATTGISTVVCDKLPIFGDCENDIDGILTVATGDDVTLIEVNFPWHVGITSPLETSNKRDGDPIGLSDSIQALLPPLLHDKLSTKEKTFSRSNAQSFFTILGR